MSTSSSALVAPADLSPSLLTDLISRREPRSAVQQRLMVVLLAGLTSVAGSFWLEDQLLPWHSRMDATTPGWSFVLSQASVLGLIVALAVPTRSIAVAQALLTATLIGYTYVFAGLALLDPRRAVQSAYLVFRAVELGLVSVAAMLLGATLRLLLKHRLTLTTSTSASAKAIADLHYGVNDLLFLTVVFAVGMWLVNLFFDQFARNQFARNEQLTEVLISIVRALPAALPWLWGLTQPRLTSNAMLTIVGLSLAVWGLKVCFEYRATGEELWLVISATGVRAIAYAAAATLSGSLLRGLGFRWARG